MSLMKMQLLSRLWNCTATAIAHLYFRSAAAAVAAAAANALTQSFSPFHEAA